MWELDIPSAEKTALESTYPGYLSGKWNCEIQSGKKMGFGQEGGFCW